MRVAADALDLEITVACVQSVADRRRRRCRAAEASIRAFQASHANRSASLRAAAARSDWARTEALKRYSRDLVVIRVICQRRPMRAIATVERLTEGTTTERSRGFALKLWRGT